MDGPQALLGAGLLWSWKAEPETSPRCRASMHAGTPVTEAAAWQRAARLGGIQPVAPLQWDHPQDHTATELGLDTGGLLGAGRGGD